jgi:hypothetical protein
VPTLLLAPLATAAGPTSPPPAEGFLDISSSTLARATREAALDNPELTWTSPAPGPGGERQTKRLNLFQAVNEGLATALASDERARRWSSAAAAAAGGVVHLPSQR